MGGGVKGAVRSVVMGTKMAGAMEVSAGMGSSGSSSWGVWCCGLEGVCGW